MPSMDESELVIGEILRTHGVRGEITIFPLTSFPERFRLLKRVILESKRGERVQFTPQQVRYRKGSLIIGFAEIGSVAEVEPFVKGLVKISKEDVMVLPDGHFYYFEIMGMEVYSEGGRYIGIIEDIFTTGSNDIYVVRDRKGEYLIPATREVVVSIDVKGKRMTLRLIKGLLGDDEM